jgi:alkylation response protein AidB-like acyl-CoA dehydrogenase
MEVTTDAAQLFACIGVSKDNRIEQYFRDAKVLQIIEGTNQTQRNDIGKHVVKTG